MVHIPPEIVALILLEATQPVYGASLSPSDKATLGSCSLVCAAWTAIAQARLFEHLDLRGGQSRTLAMFLAFFQATPHIAGAVTTLTLRHWNTRPITSFYVCFYDPFELRKTEEIEREISPAILMGIVSALPRLARLKLEGSTLHGWRKDTPLSARPIRLRALELWSMYYTPFSSSGTTYFDIFACFELDELRVGHNRGPPTRTLLVDAPALSQAAPARRIVRRLRVRDCEWFSLHALEHGEFDRESLRSIAFVALGNCSLKEAGTPLLQQHGAHLRDLTLKISSDIWLSWYTTGGIEEVFSLAVCTQLNSLHLSWWQGEMTRDIPWADDKNLGQAFRSLLASVIEQAVMRFPRLDSVTLGVSTPHELDLERRVEIIRSQIPAEILGSVILRVVRAREN